MERNIVLSLLAVAVLGSIGIWLLMPEPRDDGVQRLPWLVEQDGQGRTRVFGFTLGETTLGQVRELFAEEGEINLFARLDAEGNPLRYAVEAYFEQIYLSRLRADFVFALEVDQAMLEAMYERGLRISQLGSGSKKVKLDPADVEVLLTAPIGSITYLPWKSLDTEIIRKRFGVPAEKRTEPETGVSHWLYPGQGMDVAIDSNGGVVIQYVNRDDFGRVTAPLKDASKARQPRASADSPVTPTPPDGGQKVLDSHHTRTGEGS
jgi:hypothetical protein